jgi:carbon storage regulator
MLMLSTQIGETVNIGENVTVSVVHVKGDQVRLRIVAPHDVPVHRDGEFDRILQDSPITDEA